jgi:hypothetical protein
METKICILDWFSHMHIIGVYDIEGCQKLSRSAAIVALVFQPYMELVSSCDYLSRTTEVYISGKPSCSKTPYCSANCRSGNDFSCFHAVKCRRIALHRLNTLPKPHRPRLAEIILPIKIDLIHDEVQERPVIGLRPPRLQLVFLHNPLPDLPVFLGEFARRLVFSGWPFAHEAEILTQGRPFLAPRRDFAVGDVEWRAVATLVRVQRGVDLQLRENVLERVGVLALPSSLCTWEWYARALAVDGAVQTQVESEGLSGL